MNVVLGDMVRADVNYMKVLIFLLLISLFGCKKTCQSKQVETFKWNDSLQQWELYSTITNNCK